MIELDAGLRARLTQRAEDAAPQEACGLISAPSGTSLAERDEHGLYGLWSAENASADPKTSFLIDPDEQRRLLMHIWERNEEVVGIFHSHPRGPATPSETDRTIAEAQPDRLTWVIVGLPRCFACGGSGANEDQDDCEVCGGWGYEPDFWVGELP